MTEQNDEKLQSVVYSFAGRWEGALKSGAVKVFFRKRRPAKMSHRVFLYVGVPTKKLIGYADIRSIETVDLETALAIKGEGAITKNELVNYIGQKGTVHAIWIEKTIIFASPFDLQKLNADFGFNPPQSFSIVKPEFEEKLLAGNL